MEAVSIVYPSVSDFTAPPHFIFGAIKGLSLLLSVLTILYVVYVVFYIYYGGTSLTKEGITDVIRTQDKVTQASNDIARMIEESRKKLSTSTASVSNSSDDESTTVVTPTVVTPTVVTPTVVTPTVVTPTVVTPTVVELEPTAAVVTVVEPVATVVEPESTVVGSAVVEPESTVVGSAVVDATVVMGDKIGRIVVDDDGKKYFEYFDKIDSE